VPQALAAAVSGALLLTLDPSRLPLLNADRERERVHQVWQGSAATVAVVEQRPAQESAAEQDRNPASLRIKVNNHYSLGGTQSRQWESWQSHLPLFLHPSPRSVFYLGMGTGISAGAALEHPVERLVVTEIIPEVVEASRQYFRPYVNGLFDDPRVEVLPEDGRNHLRGTHARFDLIVADLFLPWKAGTAMLYTREHYRTARDRLERGGLYVQWLPLHQMSKQEFGMVARTLGEVFPLVTFWRGDFFSRAPVVALIGHRDPAPLDAGALGRRIAEAKAPEHAETPLIDFVPAAASLPREPARFLLYYIGNLSAAADLVADYPVNSDDRPLIEYRAPITQRRQEAGEASWFTGSELMAFFEVLLRKAPPEHDPYLAALSPAQRSYVGAGLAFHWVQVLAIEGDDVGAREALERFSRVVLR
jgi:spermidine synthase